ncbi:MAG: hypothetical protein MJ247_02045 [Alphaproteobacteria bacterium]|nr:hypothetical protein [Alphaproteobacteria bacterium]
MSNKYNEENLIHAAIYVPTPEEKAKRAEQVSAEPLAAMMFTDDRDSVLYGIFGDVPDYDNPKMESLWDEILESDPEEVYEYCFRKGVDLFMDDGKPVPGWRDVAVMLKAIDTGLLELA